MTFGDLYQSALDYELGSNDSAVLFTTAKRKAAINDGLRQFADLTECWTRRSTVTCSNAVSEYNLLSSQLSTRNDFVRLTHHGPEYHFRDSSSNATQTAGDDFPRRSEAWLNAHNPGWRESTVGTPTEWYLRQDGGSLYLGLNPPPSISTAEAAQLLVPYVARPTSLVSSTDVPFGGRMDLEPYHQGIVHFAAHKLEKLRKNTESSNQQLQAFMGYVQRFASAFRPRGGQQVRAKRSYFQDAHRKGYDDDEVTVA